MTGAETPLVECLLSVHAAQHSGREAGGSEVRSHPLLHSEPSLAYTRPCLRNNFKEKGFY